MDGIFGFFFFFFLSSFFFIDCALFVDVDVDVLTSSFFPSYIVHCTFVDGTRYIHRMHACMHLVDFFPSPFSFFPFLHTFVFFSCRNVVLI